MGGGKYRFDVTVRNGIFIDPKRFKVTVNFKWREQEVAVSLTRKSYDSEVIDR